MEIQGTPRKSKANILESGWRAGTVSLEAVTGPRFTREREQFDATNQAGLAILQWPPAPDTQGQRPTGHTHRTSEETQDSPKSILPLRQSMLYPRIQFTLRRGKGAAGDPTRGGSSFIRSLDFKVIAFVSNGHHWNDLFLMSNFQCSSH